MIQIHWVWLPLIITVLMSILTVIANKGKADIRTDLGFGLSLLTGIVAFVSIVIYVVVGLYWIFTHVKIVS